MKMFKEVETEETKILYTATLENDTHIDVYGDYALGSDGKKYYHVGLEDEEGVLQTLGWSCEADSLVVM